jgi:hypothetical protein
MMAKIQDPLTGTLKEKTVTTLTSTGGLSVEQPAPPPLTNAASYSERLKAKQAMKAAKSERIPVGGAPPIPPGKLAPIAEAGRALAAPRPYWAETETAQPDNAYGEQAPSAPPSPQMAGMGAAYGQPQLDENGRILPLSETQRTKPAGQVRSHVSPETQRLMALQKEQADRANQANEPQTESRRDQLEEAEKEMAEGNKDQLLFPMWPDFPALSEAMRKLLDPRRRKEIESRLPKLDFHQLISRGETEQVVHVIPNEYWLRFRTISQQEHFFCLQFVYENPGSSEHSNLMLNTCRLVCGLLSVNDAALTDHRKAVGRGARYVEVDKEAFINKFNTVCGYATIMLADMGIQFDWFNERIADFFSFERLKNG